MGGDVGAVVGLKASGTGIFCKSESLSLGKGVDNDVGGGGCGRSNGFLCPNAFRCGCGCDCCCAGVKKVNCGGGGGGGLGLVVVVVAVLPTG